ncbi:uncharacterized protein BDV17DRAFT_275679 [Aspergillus undulatus]|uniref:uncharacterized protein n=1 Tax=Aspergillus undulatus TaxID=1810928 RepID=UPI003CCD9A82
MPHKHKRRQNDESTYDLPPTLIAKALPVRDPSATGKNQQGKGKGKGKGKQNAVAKPQSKNEKNAAKQNEAATSRRKSALEDDTPRAFRQLMQFQERRAAGNKQKRKRDSDGSDIDSDSSEDDKPAVSRKTNTKNKKKATKVTEQDQDTSETSTKTKTALNILPGEKLSDFAARVDREMPLSQMKRSSKPTATDNLPKLQDHKITKHEKHLKRLQAQWREDDARIKEREAAEREEREEELEEQLQLWKDWEAEAGKKKRNPNHNINGKKSKGRDDDDGPDPWAKLRKKRAAVNPFDVAQEPPQLKKPREIFKVRDGAKVDVANVPASVGSLRRREELASERRNIVEEYRRLMAEKRQ